MTPERVEQIRQHALKLFDHVAMKDVVIELLSHIDELRSAAQPIIDSFMEIDDWSLGDETDRVYAWRELEPLETALRGEHERAP